MAKLEFLVGSYTDREAQGIYHVLLPDGSMEKAEVTLFAQARNPSWISLSPDKSVLLAIEEIGADTRPQLLRYEIGDCNQTRRTSATLRGSHPCHIGLHPSLPLAVTSHYGDGSASLWHYGDPEEEPRLLQHLQYSGTGPVASRQASSHAHFSLFLENGNCLAVVDLGCDAIHFYDFDPRSLKLAERQHLHLSPGSGPRHMVSVKDTLFIAGELDERVHAVKKERDSYQVVGCFAAFEESVHDEGSVSAIRASIDGRYLYVAGRRQNAIAWMAIDETCHLRRCGQVGSGGLKPRDFSFDTDGHHVIVANQESDTVALFKVDIDSGHLGEVEGQFHIHRPSCLVWLPCDLSP